MDKEKDLFKDGKGQYYESYDPERLTLMQMALDYNKIDYYSVSHTGVGSGKAVRFFVDQRDDNWMNDRVLEIEERIASGELGHHFKYEAEKYFKEIFPKR